MLHKFQFLHSEYYLLCRPKTPNSKFIGFFLKLNSFRNSWPRKVIVIHSPKPIVNGHRCLSLSQKHCTHTKKISVK